MFISIVSAIVSKINNSKNHSHDKSFLESKQQYPYFFISRLFLIAMHEHIIYTAKTQVRIGIITIIVFIAPPNPNNTIKTAELSPKLYDIKAKKQLKIMPHNYEQIVNFLCLYHIFASEGPVQVRQGLSASVPS